MNEDGGRQIMSTDDRLIYMANQIARNLATEGDNAAALTAQHIREFWGSDMRARFLTIARERPNALSDIAGQAISLLLR